MDDFDGSGKALSHAGFSTLELRGESSGNVLRLSTKDRSIVIGPGEDGETANRIALLVPLRVVQTCTPGRLCSRGVAPGRLRPLFAIGVVQVIGRPLVELGRWRVSCPAADVRNFPAVPRPATYTNLKSSACSAESWTPVSVILSLALAAMTTSAPT
jgi:hypothetical protein